MSDPTDDAAAVAAEDPLEVKRVCCKSEGGPYDDASMLVGEMVGEIRAALTMGAVTGADRFTYAVPTDVVEYLEGVAQERGYPGWSATEDPDNPDFTFVAISAYAMVSHG